jgi:hypothetical protein
MKLNVRKNQKTNSPENLRLILMFVWLIRPEFLHVQFPISVFWIWDHFPFIMWKIGLITATVKAEELSDYNTNPAHKFNPCICGRLFHFL